MRWSIFYRGEYMKVSNASKNVAKRIMSKSTAAKKAVAGTDFGKPNVPGKTGFATVAAKAGAEYGSAAAGKRVAGKIFQNMRKSGKL